MRPFVYVSDALPRGEEEGGGVRSGPGSARTILLFHIISARPSKQPLMVCTFLKVYMQLCSYFLFLQEQIKDIAIVIMQVVLFGFQLPPRLLIMHTRTLSLDGYYRPTTGKSSRPAGLSCLVCVYTVDLAHLHTQVSQ